MNAKKVAISQSNYIPWKGYFDNIALVDEFVLYDDMQYTRRDWRNRNKIKTSSGIRWLTIPVNVKGKFHQKINETKISDHHWNEKHFGILNQNYASAKCYEEVIDMVREMYETADHSTISEINYHFLSHLCSYLGITTTLSFSSDYDVKDLERTERLVDLCQQLSATDYFSGQAAKAYMNEALFHGSSINVHYFDYSGYEEYHQIYGDFEHGVSILDLIFCEGKNAVNYLKNLQ